MLYPHSLVTGKTSFSLSTKHYVKAHLSSMFLFFYGCDRAIFEVTSTWMFWFCLLAIVVTSLLPRFAIKYLGEYYRPSDVRIAREAEKLGTFIESQTMETEMNQIGDPPRR